MNDYINSIAGITEDIYKYGRENDLPNAILANKKYYTEGAKCPDIARMVYKDTFKKCDEKYKELIKNRQETLSEFLRKTNNATKNAMNATNYEPARGAFEEFKQAVDSLYPHSWWIRSFSVDRNRIVLSKGGLVNKFKTSVGNLVKKIYPDSKWADKIIDAQNHTVKGKASPFYKIMVKNLLKARGDIHFFK